MQLRLIKDSNKQPGPKSAEMELLNRLGEWKRNLNLPSAGSYENLHREARSNKNGISTKGPFFSKNALQMYR